MSVVITGANGKLGTLIIKELLTRLPAEQIIACVRQPDSAQSIAAQGIGVRFCDYDQPESLSVAFAGADKLMFISSSHHDDTVRLSQHERIIEAAKKAQVQHILYTSFAYVERGSISLTQMHLSTERAIAASGIPYTFLRNALYTDFVGALGLNSAIAEGEMVVYPGALKFNTVTREDLALGIAAVLSESGHEGMSYELTASQLWTFDELVEVLSIHTGKRIALRQDNQIQNWIFGFLNKIDTSSTSTDLEKIMGRPVTSLKDSIQRILEEANGS
ncbi:NAD(P)H-binding protein [Paenibacillus sp. RC67]|uniref:NAD(P)H-binding protein n=1 Tax=Paenibacillus sp. RC67 TaxID=3039392 RepID=UPI0024AD0E59|nr:NAD(P)H-binding protein [Paenibacillus sp. RC67]